MTNERGEITAFREKYDDAIQSNKGKRLINAGAYLLSRQFIDLIPDGRPVLIEKDLFPVLIGFGLYGFVSNGYFVDIGVPEDLARAQRELPMRSRV